MVKICVWPSYGSSQSVEWIDLFNSSFANYWWKITQAHVTLDDHPRWSLCPKKICVAALLQILQGDPNQNCPFLRAITQKLSISDPKLVKPKCGGGSFFQFSKICLHFSAVCLQFLKKNYRLSNPFWLYQHRVRSA